MSAANVELIRKAYEALNRGDLDAFIAVIHPEHEFKTSGVFPGLKPVYRGHEGIREFWRDFYELWESLRLEIEDLRGEDDRVVARYTNQARGRDGVEVRRQGAQVITVRDGLAFHTTTYASWEEALEAAGLDD